MPLDTRFMLPPDRAAAARAGGFWFDRTVLDYFDALRAKHPERVLMTGANSMTGRSVTLTWQALDQRVRRIAAGLARLGVAPGDVVSCQLPNWWEFAALHLAAMRVGAITNPLMPIFRDRELEFMLRQAEAKVLVVPERFRGFDYVAMAERLRPKLPDLQNVLVLGVEGNGSFEALQAAPAGSDEMFAARRPAADQVIQVMFTSGTTGEPKGVMHTSNTLFCNLVQFARRLGLGAGDVTLMSSPLAHQTGFLYGILNPILTGGRVVLQDIWNATEAVELIEREGITFTIASTPFLSDLTDAAAGQAERVASLRVFASGGAPIPRALVRRASEVLGASIVSLWGMTENGPVTSTKPGDPPEKVFASDGCVMPGMELKIVDFTGRPLPTEAEGRLLARGAGTFVGYLKRPEWYATDGDGWFDTGDLARMDAEGYIRITGRSKDVIIRGGENVPVVEIENLLYQHPAVAEAAIVAMPDPRLGERGCAFVVPRPGQSLSFAEMVAFLQAKRCAKHYMPERLELMPEMPRTPSGKIQKFRLREMAQGLSVER